MYQSHESYENDLKSESPHISIIPSFRVDQVDVFQLRLFSGSWYVRAVPHQGYLLQQRLSQLFSLLVTWSFNPVFFWKSFWAMIGGPQKNPWNISPKFVWFHPWFLEWHVWSLACVCVVGDFLWISKPWNKHPAFFHHHFGNNFNLLQASWPSKSKGKLTKNAWCFSSYILGLLFPSP